MENLRGKLVSPPILAHLYKRGQYTLDTHSYEVQVGSMLLHKQPNKIMKQVVYWSRSRTIAEKACHKAQRDALAIFGG